MCRFTAREPYKWTQTQTDTHTHTHTNRDTHKQTPTQTDTHINRQQHKQTLHKHTHSQTYTLTNRHTHDHYVWNIHAHTCSKTNRYTIKQTHILLVNSHRAGQFPAYIDSFINIFVVHRFESIWVNRGSLAIFLDSTQLLQQRISAWVVSQWRVRWLTRQRTMTYRSSSFYCCVIGTDEAPSRKLTLRQPLTDGGGQPVFSVAVLPHHTLANIPHNYYNNYRYWWVG